VSTAKPERKIIANQGARASRFAAVLATVGQYQRFFAIASSFRDQNRDADASPDDPAELVPAHRFPPLTGRAGGSGVLFGHG
jgi:hypothetical protein